MMKTPIRLMLTGGGTGGHIFPAIATAESLCDRLPGSEVLFIGTKRKMDAATFKQYGYATCSIHSSGLKGKSFLSLLQGLLVLPLSCVEALYHILRFRPHLVLGVGGYVTGPVVAVAKFCGKATVIHEQNSVPGFANRQLGLLATRICLSLPGSEKWFPAEKTVLTGNPVRGEIRAISETKNENKDTVLTLLVLGGSLGAHRVNELVSEAFALGSCDLQKIKVIHQTGLADATTIASIYRENNIDATVAPFFTDMAAVYQEADLLVSRAGATTLAELAVLGKPAILIPYPHAADQHQEKNAEFYVKGGGALLCREKELTADILADKLVQLFGNREQLQKMGVAMRNCAFPEAAERIVDVCLGMVNHASK